MQSAPRSSIDRGILPFTSSHLSLAPQAGTGTGVPEEDLHDGCATMPWPPSEEWVIPVCSNESREE